MDHKRNDCISVGRFLNGGGPSFQIDSPTKNQQISNLVLVRIRSLDLG
jgi:hypothetical protein